MSAFLALTLKSFKKSAFLCKGVLDARTHVWTDLTISKEREVYLYDFPVPTPRNTKLIGSVV